MRRGVIGCLLLLSCGRTEPVRYPPPPPVFPCELVITPRAIDFGTHLPGGRSSRELVVQNMGDGLCDLQGFTLGAMNDPTFTVEGAPWPRVLGPDESVALTVVFSAGAAMLPADRTGFLELRSNDETDPRANVTLRARVEFCQLTARPSPLDFGNVVLNATATGRVTITNSGSSVCVVSGLVLEPGTAPNFSLPPQPTGFTLTPGASAEVQVRFAANTSEPPHLREGALLFDSNDQLTPRGRVPLLGYINTVCTEAGQYIYTVDGDGRFARFAPRTLAYLDIAQLRCPSNSTPFSMNVDQEAIAWIIFADGNLFRVDTANGACTATSYQPNQSGFDTFGMGSVFDSRTGLDTLFLATTGSRLGTLAFPSLTVTPVGSFMLGSVELAGTGDGQLWAFAPPQGGSAVLARLDPSNATVLERYSLPNIDSNGGWAIKFFGGAFYIFIGEDIWKVERSALDPMLPEPTTPAVRVLVSPGRNIVGAGVSTCAPTQ